MIQCRCDLNCDLNCKSQRYNELIGVGNCDETVKVWYCESETLWKVRLECQTLLNLK